jgi:hypothetical protein
MFSKSQYTKYQHCHKRLWLYKNKREVMSAPAAAQEKIFETGNRIGALARTVFPGGVLVEEPYYEVEAALAKTKELLNTADTIYEAAFLYDNVLVRADILHKTADGWDMIEVKSATDVKEEYHDDVAIQAYVLKGSGVDLNKVILMHINNEYLKTADDIDVNNFFVQADLTQALTPAETIKTTLLEMTREMAAPEPAQEIAKGFCEGCEFHAYCWAHVPENSVYDLPRISDKAKLIASHGYLKIADIPVEYLSSDNHIKWFKVYKSGVPHVDKEGIKALLSELRYPLYFLDFETTAPAVPLWLNTRPYQQIVFQASLHIIEHFGEEPKHYEYLFEGTEDPRPKAAEFLLKHIGNSGTIIAHHAAFEKSRISEMMRDLDLSAGDTARLKDMLTRFWDSKEAFQKYYFHPDFNCSASIKKVLPVVAPGMTYEGMAVAHGGDAMDAFDVLYENKLPPQEAAELRQHLLDYCRQDTLAMVKVVYFLRNLL